MTVFPTLPSGKVDIVPRPLLGQFWRRLISRGKALRIYQAIWQKHIRSFQRSTLSINKTIPNLKRLPTSIFWNAMDCFLKWWHTEISMEDSPGGVIESVLYQIPIDRTVGIGSLTLCVSSQWGCVAKCSFLTGDLGLKGHLWASQPRDRFNRSHRLCVKTNELPTSWWWEWEPLHNYDQLVVALRTMNHNSLFDCPIGKITVSSKFTSCIASIDKEIPVTLPSH